MTKVTCEPRIHTCVCMRMSSLRLPNTLNWHCTVVKKACRMCTVSVTTGTCLFLNAEIKFCSCKVVSGKWIWGPVYDMPIFTSSGFVMLYKRSSSWAVVWPGNIYSKRVHAYTSYILLQCECVVLTDRRKMFTVYLILYSDRSQAI